MTLTHGFWAGKYEATQGDWKRVVGELPGPLTGELPEGNNYPVGNVNFAEAEAFCRKLTELSRKSASCRRAGSSPADREAQWEYACRGGTKSATAFGDKLSSNQANFKGKPYNGGELGHRSVRRPRSAATRQTPGDCTTCTATSSSGAGTGTTRASRRHRSRSSRRTVHGQRNRSGGSSRRRGGGWCDDGWPCRSAFRLRFEPERRYDHIGFRVAAVRTNNRNFGPRI